MGNLLACCCPDEDNDENDGDVEVSGNEGGPGEEKKKSTGPGDKPDPKSGPTLSRVEGRRLPEAPLDPIPEEVRPGRVLTSVPSLFATANGGDDVGTTQANNDYCNCRRDQQK